MSEIKINPEVFRKFRDEVIKINPKVGNWKNSSLHGLKEILSPGASWKVKSGGDEPKSEEADITIETDNIKKELTKLPKTSDGTYGNKFNKYNDAIYYLLETLLDNPVKPKLSDLIGTDPLEMRGLKEDKAAMFTKNNVESQKQFPGSYFEDKKAKNPVFKQEYEIEEKKGEEALKNLKMRELKGWRMNPSNFKTTKAKNSSFLEQTCESFLLSSDKKNGVILIHLSDFQNSMNTVYNGRKVLDHINSVLRVAALTNTPVCVLTMKDTAVCARLKEYKKIQNPEVITREKGHMGSADQKFVAFADEYENCVVMGFDTFICVKGNIFGAAESLEKDSDISEESLKNGKDLFFPPLISLTNIITSKAVLVTDPSGIGGIYDDEYSPLKP